MTADESCYSWPSKELITPCSSQPLCEIHSGLTPSPEPEVSGESVAAPGAGAAPGFSISACQHSHKLGPAPLQSQGPSQLSCPDLDVVLVGLWWSPRPVCASFFSILIPPRITPDVFLPWDTHRAGTASTTLLFIWPLLSLQALNAFSKPRHPLFLNTASSKKLLVKRFFISKTFSFHH